MRNLTIEIKLKTQFINQLPKLFLSLPYRPLSQTGIGYRKEVA